MIAFVRGDVVTSSRPGDVVVVDLGMCGVSVQCTRRTVDALRPGERVLLATAMVVREDAWTLYGFLDEAERDVFELVQTVSGIGPRMALAMLSTLTPDELRAAVQAEDLNTLTSVPGIGRKGAARIALELKDRLGPGTSSAGGPALPRDDWATAVHSGLMSLGWSAREASAAVESVAPLARAEPTPPVADLLKAALLTLDRR